MCLETCFPLGNVTKAWASLGPYPYAEQSDFSTDIEEVDKIKMSYYFFKSVYALWGREEELNRLSFTCFLEVLSLM